MLLRSAIIASTFVAFSVGATPAAAQNATAGSAATDWVIGPIVRRRNYSVGMPLHPTPRRGGGFYIDLPNAPGSVHYVTFRHGSLAGKRRIRIRYRIEAEPGTKIVASSDTNYPGWITPYFQRAGDTWTARGRYETYRWYGTFATKTLEPGVFEIVAPFSAKWSAIERSSSHDAPDAFRDAMMEADQVGFVLGGGDGYGHGAHVERGRARLVVTHFSVE